VCVCVCSTAFVLRLGSGVGGWADLPCISSHLNRRGYMVKAKIDDLVTVFYVHLLEFPGIFPSLPD
jgi:hypothetical protein